jgi:hypothetical protein
MAWESRHGHAYNEAAFRYLLALERRRSERLGLPLLLLLVELESSPPWSSLLDRRAARLFAALVGCARETDIIGWYRRDRVAGIVLTELGSCALEEVSDLVRARAIAALNGAVASRVHVRIFGISGRPDEVCGHRGRG